MSEADSFRDHCGVVGIFNNEEASHLTYLALYALQHRGQDSAGIVTSDGVTQKRHVGKGLVADAFDDAMLAKLKGKHAVGHVRYTTAGVAGIADAQPLLTKTCGGEIAIAHNGNLINGEVFRRKLEDEGAIFHTSSDTEVICHLFARSKEESVVGKLTDALNQVKGAFSITALIGGKLIAARDPHGIRPLVLGRLKKGYIVASEDCAFELVQAEYVREIEPGECLVIDDSGLESHSLFMRRDQKPAPCIFEHVYFARPDSNIFGVAVHQSRRQMGAALARDNPVEADVVIPVPDSGCIAAMGYAQESGIPYEHGLVRNHYVGRTFIEPESKIRHFGVKVKLSPVKSVVEGKRVVVVDDSIVRGTTSKKIVQMLRSAGVKEIHMRVAAPPSTNPCYYGIDTPRHSELIASKKSLAEIQDYIGVDSLAYLSLPSLHGSLGRANACKTALAKSKGYCDACFSGNYPIALS